MGVGGKTEGITINKKRSRENNCGGKGLMHKCAFETDIFGNSCVKMFLRAHCFFSEHDLKYVPFMFRVLFIFFRFLAYQSKFSKQWCSTYSKIGCPIDPRLKLRHWQELNHFICVFFLYIRTIRSLFRQFGSNVVLR